MERNKKEATSHKLLCFVAVTTATLKQKVKQNKQNSAPYINTELNSNDF